MTPYRIALAAPAVPPDRDAAVNAAIAAVGEAGRAGAGVVCFPECFVPGYRVQRTPVPPLDGGFLEEAWDAVAAAAARARVTVILGTERRDRGARLLSALVIAADGSRAGFQDKVQLDPSEEAVYSAGAGRHLFVAGPLRFGVVICHEGWRYPETVRAAARLGAQVVFHPHFDEEAPGTYRERFGDPANTFHEKAILCRAAENTCYFASVNCAGAGSATTSAVARPDGTLLAWQPYGRPGLLLADLDLDLATGYLASRLRSG